MYLKWKKDLLQVLMLLKAKLTTAREAGNITEEVEAQKEIAKLGYEEARLAEMKLNQEAKSKEKSELIKQQPNIQQGTTSTTSSRCESN